MSDADREPFDDSFHGPDPVFRESLGTLGGILLCLAIWGLMTLVAKVANPEVDLKWGVVPTSRPWEHASSGSRPGSMASGWRPDHERHRQGREAPGSRKRGYRGRRSPRSGPNRSWR